MCQFEELGRSALGLGFVLLSSVASFAEGSKPFHVRVMRLFYIGRYLSDTARFLPRQTKVDNKDIGCSTCGLLKRFSRLVELVPYLLPSLVAYTWIAP